jgi:hypothetical protein
MNRTTRDSSVFKGWFFVLAAMFFVVPFLFCRAAADTSSPTIPASLQLAGKSGTTIQLSWSASSDNVGVVGYAIYRDGLQIGTSLSTSFTDNTATSSSSHSYSVVAYDAASNASAQSNSLSVVVGGVYYVSTSGNDSDSGNFSSPWLTWDKAITTAVAGDIIYFRSGSYQVAANYLETANSGSAISPIIIKAYPGESPVVTANGAQAVVIVEHPYWVFDGLRFEMTNLPDHDHAMIRVSDNDNASNITIKNCVFRLFSSVGKDNEACIILQSNRSNNALIENNEFYGFSSSTNPVSEASGIQYLGGGNVGTKILNNKFHNLKLGVYVKHANGDTVSSGAEIANNHFYDCHRSLYGQPTFINIHNNLAVRCSAELGDNGGGVQGRNSILNHNTFYDSALILQNPSEGPVASSTITNNIFMNVVQLSPWGSGSLLHHDSNLSYNLYTSGTSTFLEYGNSYSLSGWISYYGGDSGSATGIPVFSSPSPSALADFVLSGGSPGKDAASDGYDIGADINLVGIKTPPAGDTLPPTGSISINNGNDYTNQATTTLSFSASDDNEVTEMKISNDAGSFQTLFSWPFISSYSWVLPVVDGVKTVYVWFCDNFGNWDSVPYTDTITLDTLSPSFSGVTISGVTANSAIISWGTSEDTVGFINYGYTVNYVASTSEELTYNTVHSASISSLSPSTNYNFKIVSTDHAGNRSRSSNYYFTTATSAVQDITPPSRTLSLSISNTTSNSASLTWGAPGDDGMAGLAFSYDVRYANWKPNASSTPLEIANWWNNAHQLNGEPQPHAPTTIEYMNVVGLLASTTYHFALKTVDEVGNISPVSNIVTIVTTSTSPSGSETPSESAPPSGSSGGSSSASVSGSSSGGVSSVTGLYIPVFWAIGTKNQILLYWQNPTAQTFFKVKLYRKSGEFQKKENDPEAKLLYDGVAEKYIDIEINKGENYYYSLYAYDRNLVVSSPRTLQASTESANSATTTDAMNQQTATTTDDVAAQEEITSLAGVESSLVEKVTAIESAQVIDQADDGAVILSDVTKKIYEKIIALSPTELSAESKYSIASFIHNGTPTTRIIGAGERGGSIASFNNAFGRLPQNENDWQDVIKIANGRWPKQRNLPREKWVSTDVFYRIYGRVANMNNRNDNAAVTVITYGLRPGQRNVNSEKAGITAFKYIAKRAPTSAQDWDIVRAIAYSGAKR